MKRRNLSPDGLRLTLLAAIAGSLGCADDTPAPGDDPAPARGLVACVPDEELGYPGSGVMRCEAGFLHRQQALACRPDLLVEGSPGYPQSRPANSTCLTNADCRQAPDGYCVQLGERLLCAYGCRQDSDCAANQLCLCTEGLAGTCVAADCRTDADCPAGSLCTGPRDLNGLVSQDAIPVHFACQSERDECAGDCFSGPCHYRPELGERLCGGPGAVPGRPFVVLGQARTAPVTAGAGWLATGDCLEDPNEPELSPGERERLVEHWRRVAQMEHASVAAFARFSLQLLSLGAPARLLAAAARAQHDEIRHAEAAFGLATLFHGSPLGPGPLSLSGLSSADSLQDIVVGTFVEGCIGETIAALEAAAALARAEHPLVRAALADVAEDEARHAELAWSFLAWVLERGGASVLPALRAACATARAQRAPEGDPGERLGKFGVLSSAQLAPVRTEAWASVIEPCLAALQERVGTIAQHPLLGRGGSLSARSASPG